MSTSARRDHAWEETNLLPIDADEDARTQRWPCSVMERRKSIILALIVVLLMVVLSIRNKIDDNDANVNNELFADKLVLTTPKKNKVPLPFVPNNKCIDILLGAWVETCFIVAHPHGVFPGRQGILSYPILVTRATDGGLDLHGYSIRDPFFDGHDYVEQSHSKPSSFVEKSPSPTRHCKAQFHSTLRIGNTATADNGDYYWNRISHDTVFSGNGKDATCHFRRIYGNECRQVRETVMNKFLEFNMTVHLPNETELCE